VTFTVKLRGAVGCPKLAEFACDDCGIFDETVSDATASAPCPDCGADSSRILSAHHTKVESVIPTAVVRGGDTERRPGMLDTRPLADGMPMKEWRKIQDGHRQERQHQKLIKRGLKQRRIQVG